MRQQSQQQQFQASFQPIRQSFQPTIIQYSAGTSLPPSNYIIPQNSSVSTGIKPIQQQYPMVLSYSMPQIQQSYTQQSMGLSNALTIPRINSPAIQRPISIANQPIFQMKSTTGQISNHVYSAAIPANSKNIPQNYQSLSSQLPINLRSISPVRIPQPQTVTSQIQQQKQTFQNNRQTQQLQQITHIPVSQPVTGFQQEYQYLTQSQTIPRSLTPPHVTSKQSNSAQITPIRSLDRVNPLKQTNSPQSPCDTDSLSFKPEFTHSQTKTIKIKAGSSPLKNGFQPYSNQDQLFNYSTNRSRSNQRQNGQRDDNPQLTNDYFDNSETIKQPKRQIHQVDQYSHKEYSQKRQDLHDNIDGLEDKYSQYYSKDNQDYNQVQSKQSWGYYSQEVYPNTNNQPESQLQQYRSHSQSRSQHLAQSNENIERLPYASLRSSPSRNNMYQSSNLPMSSAQYSYTDKEYRSEQYDPSEVFKYDQRGYVSETQGVKQQSLSKVISSTDKLLLEIANKYLTSQHSTTQSVSQPSPRQPSDLEFSSGSERVKTAWRSNWKDQDQIKENITLSREGGRQIGNDGFESRFPLLSSVPPVNQRSQTPQMNQNFLTEEAYENQRGKQVDYQWEGGERVFPGRLDKEEEMVRDGKQQDSNAQTQEELRKLLTKQQYYQQFELKLQQQQQQIANNANTIQKQQEYQQLQDQQQYQYENQLRQLSEQHEYNNTPSQETFNYHQQQYTPYEQLQQAQIQEQIARNQQLAYWEYSRQVQNTYSSQLLATPAFRQQLTQLPKTQETGEYYQYAQGQLGENVEGGYQNVVVPQDVGGFGEGYEWKGTQELEYAQDERDNQGEYENNREDDSQRVQSRGKDENEEQEEDKNQERNENEGEEQDYDDDNNPNNQHIQNECDDIENNNNNNNNNNSHNSNENDGDQKVDYYQHYSEEDQDQLENQIKDQTKMDIYMQAQRVKERLLEMRAQMDEFRIMNSDHKSTTSTGQAGMISSGIAVADQSVRSLENNPTQNSQVDDSQGIQLQVFSQCSNEKSTHNQFTGSSPLRDQKPLEHAQQYYQNDKFWSEDQQEEIGDNINNKPTTGVISSQSTARKRTKEQLDPISEEDIVSNSLENCKNPISEFIAEDKLQQFVYKNEFAPFDDAAVDVIAFPQGNSQCQNEQLLFSQGSYENILEIYPNAGNVKSEQEQMSSNGQSQVKRNSVNQIGLNGQQGNTSNNNSSSNYHLRSQSDPQSNNQFQSFENTESQARSTVSQHSRQISSISSSFEMLSEQRSNVQNQKEQQIPGHSYQGSTDSQNNNINNGYNNGPILIEENIVQGEIQLENNNKNTNDEHREEIRDKRKMKEYQEDEENKDGDGQDLKVELDGRIKQEEQDDRFKYEKSIQNNINQASSLLSPILEVHNDQDTKENQEKKIDNSQVSSTQLGNNILDSSNKEGSTLQPIETSSSSSMKQQLSSPSLESKQIETVTVNPVQNLAISSNISQSSNNNKQAQDLSSEPVKQQVINKSKIFTSFNSGDIIKTILFILVGWLVASFLLFFIQSIPILSLGQVKIRETELRQQKILEEQARQALEEQQRLYEQQNQAQIISQQISNEQQQSSVFIQESEWCVSNAARYLLRNKCQSIQQNIIEKEDSTEEK